MLRTRRLEAPPMPAAPPQPLPEGQPMANEWDAVSEVVPESEWDAVSEKVDDVAGAAALKGAEGISETPLADRPMKLLPWLPEGAWNIELPSPIAMAEMLPGAGSMAGAAIGGPTLVPSMIGGMAGEGLRQVLRKAAGYAPATGNVQSMMKLDPNSPAAGAVGMLAEGATAAIPDFTKWMAPTRGLREGSLKSYAKILPAQNAAERAANIETLRPIAEELPFGTVSRIQNVATKKSDVTGKAVGDLYNVDVPASFKPALDELRELELKQVRGKAVVEGPPPKKGQGPGAPKTVKDIQDKALHKALKERADELDTAYTAETQSPLGTSTVQKIFEARKTADTLAKRASDKAFGKGLKNYKQNPKTQAYTAERTKHSEVLHSPDVWEQQYPGQGADIAAKAEGLDARFSALQSLVGLKEAKTNDIINRWALSRSIPGRTGTMLGYAASAGATPIRAGLSKLKLELAKAIESGNDRLATQLFNTIVNDYEQAHKKAGEK